MKKVILSCATAPERRVKQKQKGKTQDEPNRVKGHSSVSYSAVHVSSTNINKAVEDTLRDCFMQPEIQKLFLLESCSGIMLYYLIFVSRRHFDLPNDF